MSGDRPRETVEDYNYTDDDTPEKEVAQTRKRNYTDSEVEDEYEPSKKKQKQLDIPKSQMAYINDRNNKKRVASDDDVSSFDENTPGTSKMTRPMKPVEDVEKRVKLKKKQAPTKTDPPKERKKQQVNFSKPENEESDSGQEEKKKRSKSQAPEGVNPAKKLKLIKSSEEDSSMVTTIHTFSNGSVFISLPRQCKVEFTTEKVI